MQRNRGADDPGSEHDDIGARHGSLRCGYRLSHAQRRECQHGIAIAEAHPSLHRRDALRRRGLSN